MSLGAPFNLLVKPRAVVTGYAEALPVPRLLTQMTSALETLHAVPDSPPWSSGQNPSASTNAALIRRHIQTQNLSMLPKGALKVTCT